MSSVIGPVECPNCKEEACIYLDRPLLPDDIWITCPECYYSYTRTRKITPDDEYLGDGSKNEHYEIEEAVHDNPQFVKLMPVTNDPDAPSHDEDGIPLLHILRPPEASPLEAEV